jgi:intracellular septation protein
MIDEVKRIETLAPPNPIVKFAIEIGPLVAFLVAWAVAGILWATGALMVASAVSLVASRIFLGRVPPVVMATAVLVFVFGGLTLWFQDPSFIKLKPTIINLLFAGVLIVGLIRNQPFLKMLFGEAFNLTEEGWRKLTMRWIVFFVVLAGLNEVIRLNFSDAVWVNFKAYGILTLTLVFAMAQIGFIRRHEAKAEA